jgi:hypothetical protein
MVEFPNINRETSSIGHTKNRYFVGSSFFWSPFFFLGHIATNVVNSFGGSLEEDGYSTFYVYFSMLGSSLYALFGLLLLFWMLRRFFSESVSLLTVIGIWFASPLVFYMWFLPSQSHAVSFFAVTAFAAYWLKTRAERSNKQWLILGLLAGLMTLVRPQNLLFTAIPLAESLVVYWKERVNIVALRKQFVKNILFLVTLVVGLLPQLIVLKMLMGSPFAFLQATDAGRQLSLLPVNVLNVLFNFHGLFSWTPLLLVGVIGLYFLYKKDKQLAIYFSITFLLVLWILSSWQGWFGAAAFGQRKFVSSLFIFAFGLAALLQWLRDKRIRMWVLSVVVFLFMAWNLGLLIQFGSRMIPAQEYVSLKTIAYNNFVEVPKTFFGIAKKFLFSRSEFLRT